MTDSRVIVADDDGRKPAPPLSPPPSGPRAAFGALLVAAVVIVGLVLVGVAPDPEPGQTGGLGAPNSAAQPAVTAPPAAVPEIALGWRRLDLPGRGTVVELAHGGGGWMALSHGEQSTVATSTDGRIWVTRSFPGPLDGDVLGMVTPTRHVVVDTGAATGGATRSWVSTDGGVTWDTALFPPGYGRVTSLVSAGDRIVAGGATSTDPRDIVEEGSATTAMAWHYADGRWVPLAFSSPPGAFSSIEALVTTSDGVMAFGRVDEGPAAWRLEGLTLVPVSVSVPRVVEASSFSAVTRSMDGWWLAEFRSRSSASYATSTDLARWDLLGAGLVGSRSTSVAATGLGIIGVGEDDQQFRLVDRSGIHEVRYRYPDTFTGFDPDRHTSVVASDGDLIVMGGGTYSPALWLRGLTGGRVGVTAEPSTQEGRWRLAGSFGSGFWDQDPRPFRVVQWEGGYAVATPQAVWHTTDLIGVAATRDDIVPERLIATRQGLLAVDSGAALLGSDGSGGWEPENLGFAVAGVTETASSVIAYGWTDRGEAVLALRPDGGSWEIVTPDSASTIYPVAAAAGLVFGFDAERSAEDGGRFSSDGVTWEPIELDAVRGLESGIPFVVVERSQASTTIQLLDEQAPLVVPSIDPVEAVRVGEIVRVRGSDGLWETSDEGTTWIAYPIGLEQRLIGPLRLAPTEEPIVLLAARDSYRILVFER